MEGPSIAQRGQVNTGVNTGMNTDLRNPGDPIDFVERGHTLTDQLPARLLKRCEKPLLNDLLHGGDRGILKNNVAKFVVHVEEFEDCSPAAIPGSQAL